MTSEPLQPKPIAFSWCGKVVMKYSIFPAKFTTCFPLTPAQYREPTVATDSSVWWVNAVLLLEWKICGLWVTHKIKVSAWRVDSVKAACSSQNQSSYEASIKNSSKSTAVHLHTCGIKFLSMFNRLASFSLNNLWNGLDYAFIHQPNKLLLG